MPDRTSSSNRRLLHQLHSTLLVDQMIEVYSDESRDERLRRHLFLMLSCIPDPRISALMFELLTDTACELRYHAARALWRLRRREDIPRIIELIHHSDMRTRCYAITIVGKRKIKSAIPAILEVLSDSHAEVRRRAVIALRRIRDSSAIPALREMTGDRSASVRHEVLNALSRLS